jgi:hypothetical protein
LHIEAAEASERVQRVVRGEILRRGSGVVVSIVVGPAAAVFGVVALGMSALEASALLFLISAWLGPLLMGRGDA